MSEPCPACLEGHCVLHEHGRDPNTFDLSEMFGPNVSMDLKKSVLLWRQEAQNEQDERARLIRQFEYERSRKHF